MTPTLADRIDSFGRRHLWLTVALTVVLAVAATLVLLGETKTTGILYERF